MSDFSSRRALYLTLVSFFVAAAAFSATPSGRIDARMVYNPATTHTILFGGTTAVDAFGSKLSYEFSDTWDWNGSMWTQLFPLHVPTGRYGQAMAYDSARNRIVMFGGRTGNGKTDLNDTWVFKNGDWTQLNPPNSPPARLLAGAAYDPLRDRVVLFGGATITSDNKTTTPYHDTWEFDGTTWTQVLSDGPKIDKPLVVWDNARANVFMLGVDASIATHQFTYNPQGPGWNENTSTRLPSCVNEGALVANPDTGTVFFTGGVCNGVNTIEDNEEWDGNQWNPKTVKLNVGRLYGLSMTYDQSRQVVFLFGGNLVTGGTPRNEFWAYDGTEWDELFDPNFTPAARSLAVFRTDPNANRIWLFGGSDPNTTYGDLWQYQYGKWQRVVTNTPPPSICTSMASAFDTTRNKLVVLCADSTLHEFDETDWKDITGLSKTPPVRSFSSMAYDQNIKKSVLFGGYITDYINQTWLWDGTSWSENKGDQPPQRENASMWFDPHLNRTVLFGGVGRQSSQDRVIRFNDMWSFDGNNWSQIKPAHVPPPRTGAQVAVDPRTGNALLFGGLRQDTIQTTSADGTPTTQDIQVYADDFWQWDGTDWTQVTFARTPYARENAGMAYDPSTQTIVIFGGYAGQQYLSDVWTLKSDNSWQPTITNVTKVRGIR